jgi:ribosomal protection tetracycline resistance protein
VYFGAALSGVGVDELLHAIPTVLGSVDADTSGPASGAVFKIERGASGEKVAFVRMISGTVRTRDRLQLGGDQPSIETVTAIDVFDRGTTERRSDMRAGEIAKVHGLSSARIGDTFGPNAHTIGHVFAPPTLETAIVPRIPSQKRAVFDALVALAEQDPLINLRQDDTRQELFLSLYGEVQKEIVAQTLQDEHGLDIEFRPTTPVCVARPNGSGAAIELLRRGRSPHHPFLATVGLAISPLPPGTGVTFELDVSVKSIPIHVFDTVDAFRQLMHRTVQDTLRQGIHGWEVTDCRVVMTDCGYQAPPRRWPGTTLSDYRLLTPLVLMAALQQAGTTVLEPVLDFRLEIPARDLGAIMSVLDDLDARPGVPDTRGSTCVLDGVIRVARVHHLQSRLPDLTSGEGVLESAFAGYRPIDGPPPSRPRTDRNPLDRTDYLRRVAHTG